MKRENSLLEQQLRVSAELEVLVIARDHANCDSLPLRYGIHFAEDTPLRLRRICFLYPDYQYPDRFHVEAEFDRPDIEGETASGHFVIGTKAGRSEPVVITVWRGDVKTEMRLSEIMIALRRREFITPTDLLELHPLYVNGQVGTAADLIRQLTLKMTAERVKDMEAETKVAYERADQAEAARDAALKRASRAEEIALEATYIVDQLEEKTVTLTSRVSELEAENERYKAEAKEAQRDHKEATLSTPDTLLEVREQRLYRGSLCTILIMGDGTQRHMKTSTFDRYGDVTRKAKSLVGRRVRISCWDPIGQPGRWSNEGYFRNVYAAE